MLVQVANRNLGDAAITDTAKYLIAACLQEKTYQIFDYSITSGDIAALRYADVIIFSGGGIIKFRQEKFDQYIIKILNEAERLSIPVFLNAVGVEGYDEEDPRCQALKRALNLPCVKGISIRDDTKTMREQYITNPDIPVISVFDPATWSTRVYPLSSAPTPKLIGLGVTREGLFADYGNPQIDRVFLLDFWKEVARKIEARGMQWAIFTNGALSDEVFAQAVLEHIGHGKILPKPAEPSQLVDTICSFETIIACRMHTNILAHTYGIPSIGLVWNEKLALWGKKIGHSDRFLRPVDMVPELVVEKAIKAAEQGCNKLSEEQLSLSKNALGAFLREYATVRSSAYRHDCYKKKLAADALGGKYLKYKNMNTLDSMTQSIQAGFCWLEVDVRLTSDGQLVCVNGWNKDTYKQLGLNPDSFTSKGICVEYFKKLRYEQLYPTTTFEEVVALMARRYRFCNVSLLLDVGRPSQKDLQKMLKQLKALLLKYYMLPNRFVIRLQKRADVEAVQKSRIPWKIAYYLPKEEEVMGDSPHTATEVADFCAESGISMVTMTLSRCSTEVVDAMHKRGIRCCLMKCSKVEDILAALDNGVDLVCSVYADVQTLESLTG